MSAQGRSEKVTLLEELVTELAVSSNASPPPAIGRGRRAGVTLTKEVFFDAVASAALDSAMKAEAVRVAVLLAAAPDPKAAAGTFQKLLLAEIASGHAEGGQ